MKPTKNKKTCWILEKKMDFVIIFIWGVLLFPVFLNTAFADEGFLVRSRDCNSVDASLIENLLTDLELITKDNYDKIETWQGTREFFNLRVYEGDRVNNRLQKAKIDVPVVPKRLGIVSEGTINFKVDSKRDMIWSQLYRNKGQSYKNMETMEAYGTFGFAFDTKIIARPDFIMRATPSRFKKDGTIAANSASKFKTQRQLFFSNAGWGTDPRDFFKLIGPTWHWLSSLKMLLSMDGPTFKTVKDEIVVEKSDANDIEYYIRFAVLDNNESNIESFYEIILPLRTGFNPTLIRILNAPGNTLWREINVDYVELKGIYLPSNVRTIDYSDDGNVILDKKYIFKEQQINEVIPEGAFTYNNLGLKDGDKFIDKILSREYTYQEGELIPASKNRGN